MELVRSTIGLSGVKVVLDQPRQGFVAVVSVSVTFGAFLAVSFVAQKAAKVRDLQYVLDGLVGRFKRYAAPAEYCCFPCLTPAEPLQTSCSALSRQGSPELAKRYVTLGFPTDPQ